MKTKKRGSPPIYEFDDLEDYIKSTGVGYRYLEEKSKLHKATLHKIIHGTMAALDPQKVLSFSKVLGLNQQEQIYFSLLCQCKQTKDPATQVDLTLQLQWLRNQNSFETAPMVVSEFNINIIKKIACLPYSNGSAEDIYKALQQQLSLKYIQETLLLLQEKGFILSQGNGFPFQNNAHTILTSQDESSIESIKWALSYFNRQTSKSNHTTIQNYNFGTTEEGLHEIQTCLKKSFYEIKHIIDQHSFAANQLHQINIQQFPLGSFKNGS